MEESNKPTNQETSTDAQRKLELLDWLFSDNW